MACMFNSIAWAYCRKGITDSFLGKGAYSSGVGLLQDFRYLRVGYNFLYSNSPVMAATRNSITGTNTKCIRTFTEQWTLTGSCREQRQNDKSDFETSEHSVSFIDKSRLQTIGIVQGAGIVKSTLILCRKTSNEPPPSNKLPPSNSTPLRGRFK